MLIRLVDNDKFSYIIRSIRGVDFFSAQHLFFKLHFLKTGANGVEVANVIHDLYYVILLQM